MVLFFSEREALLVVINNRITQLNRKYSLKIVSPLLTPHPWLFADSADFFSLFSNIHRHFICISDGLMISTQQVNLYNKIISLKISGRPWQKSFHRSPPAHHFPQLDPSLILKTCLNLQKAV